MSEALIAALRGRVKRWREAASKERRLAAGDNAYDHCADEWEDVLEDFEEGASESETPSPDLAEPADEKGVVP